MNNKHFDTLGFTAIKERLAEYASTNFAQEKALSLVPSLREIEVQHDIKETSAARRMIDTLGAPSVPKVDHMKILLELIEKEGILYPHQLEQVVSFVASCRRFKYYLQKGKAAEETMAYTGDDIHTLDEIYDEINRCLSGQEIDSNATPELRNLRRKIENTTVQMQNKLAEILKAKQSYCSEKFYTQKNGRYTIPVKKEYKNMVSGTVVATSNKGSTVFMEPSSISKLAGVLDGLKTEENWEIERILYTIASCIYLYKDDIATNISLIESLDFAFSKGKLSADMNGCVPTVVTTPDIKIIKGRHPQISYDLCVPIDFSLCDGMRGIVITGPNTGGKTAVLKLVGLFSIMAQSGLHLPAESAQTSIRSNVLCDIGDGQSIAQNLSTFSAHILNVIDILSVAGKESLVILDEVGSGTDPTEGVGIAISILEELRKRNCLIVVTTHYEKVKGYTEGADGFVNARMTFDRDTLQPNYQLVIGEAGESCALHIAKKLGFPHGLLKHAYQESYGNEVTPDGIKFLSQLSEEKVFTKNTGPKVEKIKVKGVQSEHALSFGRGDSVHILPDKIIGIVYQSCDDKGNVGVQIRGEKKIINHKRLELKVKADQMYPPDYDFSVIFSSVEYRKTSKAMSKRHVNGIEIEVDGDGV